MLRPCPAALPDVLADVNGDHACSSNVSRENDMDDAAAPPEAFESSKMARTLNRMKVRRHRGADWHPQMT